MSNTSKPGNGSANHCGDELKKNSRKLEKTIDAVLGIPINPAPVVDTSIINDYANLQQEAIMLTFDRDNFTGAIARYVAQLKDLGVSNQGVQAELIRVSNERTDLLARIDGVINGYVTLSERYSQIEADLKESNKESKTLGTANKELEKMLKAAGGIISAGEETVEELGKKLEQITADYEQRLDALRGVVGSKDAALNAAGQDVQKKDNLIAELSEDNEAYLEAYEFLENELKETVAQDEIALAATSQNNQEKERLLAELRERNANLNTENSAYQRRVRSISDALQKAQDKLISETESGNLTKEELAELKQRKTELEAWFNREYALLKGAHDVLLDSHTRKEAEAAELQTDLKESENLVKCLNTECTDRQIERRKLMADVASKEEDIAEYDLLNTSLNAECTARQIERTQLQKNLGKAQEDIAAKAAENAALAADKSTLTGRVNDLESALGKDWTAWAGLGSICAMNKDYNGVLFNYAQAINCAEGNVKPYLDFGNTCLNMLNGNMADDAIGALSAALDDCKLSRKDKRKVLELRADLYRFTGQRKEAVKDWKRALGKPVLGWFADWYSGLSLNRNLLKRRIKELAPYV